MMKTPITVLRELMVKFSQSPEYECVAQDACFGRARLALACALSVEVPQARLAAEHASGVARLWKEYQHPEVQQSEPHHMAVFEYRCKAHGHEVSATARSKKEAKREAARLMLARLAGAGLAVPPQYAAPALPGRSDEEPVAAGSATRTYMALLKKLCQENNLPGPEYTLEDDTGPAHARRFTARGAVGAHARLASATTEDAAQQLVAQQLYRYLRGNLARLKQDFVEEDARARAAERAPQRSAEARAGAAPRPGPALRVDDYHLGLVRHLDEGQLRSGSEALAATVAVPCTEPEAKLKAVTVALGLHAEWHSLPAEGGALALLKLVPTARPLVFAGRSRAQAAAEGLAYLRLAMKFRNTN